LFKLTNYYTSQYSSSSAKDSFTALDTFFPTTSSFFSIFSSFFRSLFLMNLTFPDSSSSFFSP